MKLPAFNTYNNSSKKNVNTLFSLFLILPSLILVGFTVFIPIVKSVYMSFLNYKLSASAVYKWNNFTNYKEIFTEGELLSSLTITVIYVFVVVALLLILGLALSVVLNKDIKGRKIIRSVILLPWVMPTVITALLWMWIFQPQYGVLNYILQSLSIISQPISWVTSVDYALPSVIVASLWRQLPFMVVMLLAGLQSIPNDMYEAARIDGANSVQLFFKITLPYLRNIIKSTVLISIIDNFKQFPLFWIMTGGGPMNKTSTLAILTYKNAFVNLNFGKGAAVSTVWLVLLLVFSTVYNKVLVSNRE